MQCVDDGRTELERANARHKAFHATIAERAAALQPKPCSVRYIPNAPYGEPKPGVKVLGEDALPDAAPEPKRPDPWFRFIDVPAETEDDPTVRGITVAKICIVVARHYQVTLADIRSARRTANVVRPRQIAMYLAKILTLRSLPEIGRRFGDRDHTTVFHAIRKITNLVASDVDLAEQVSKIEREILGNDRQLESVA